MYHCTPDLKYFAGIVLVNDFYLENPLYTEITSQDIE